MAFTHQAAIERPRCPTSKRKTQQQGELDFNKRYGTGYNRLCAIAHRRTHQICCCCLWRRAEQIHHAFYKKDGDVIGFNVFPVDAECHAKICHNKENWITDLVNPVWNNRNTEKFIQQLRENYKMLSQGIE